MTAADGNFLVLCHGSSQSMCVCVCAVLSLQVPALPASAGWLEQCGDGEGKRMTAAAEAEYTERERHGGRGRLIIL